MADRLNRPSGDLVLWSVPLVLLALAVPSLAAPPADMEAVIEEYEADQNSVSRFYDMPWSTARFDRTERLQHDWQARLGGLEFDRLDHAWPG